MKDELFILHPSSFILHLMSTHTFARLRLAPDILPKHALGYYLSAMSGILLLTYMPQAQPLILSDFLKVDGKEVGKISGDLGFYAELVALATINLWGSWSDKVGRRLVYALGFLLIAVGLLLAPLSSTLTQFTLARLVFALGASAVTGMISTVIADYISGADRGRAGGLQGIMNGVGALITVFLLLRLPNIFQNSGLSAIDAGRNAYWVVGGIALLSAILMMLMLKPGLAARENDDNVPLTQLLREGARAAKDPAILLSYFASFAARGDLAIVGTFFTLWVAQYAINVAGMNSPAALARAGVVVGVAQTFALIGAPIIGILSDKLKRIDAVILAAAMGSVGYLSTIFVTDPLGISMFISAALIGLGEVAGVIASGVLIAERAPRQTRGSIIGFFGLCGGIGILIATKIGGILFDVWRPAAPFILFGLAGIIVVIYGLAIRNRVSPPSVSS